MRFQTLSDWLCWQEQLHPKSIDLGLTRVLEVWRRLQAEDFSCPVISVGGTNGKGSCVAMLQSIYHTAGYAVGSYTSPHLWRYNERININGEPVSDVEICAAFARVDEARQDITLTYFEFGTLAALDIFKQYALDVVILEVGLGGRLDAVNIIDADVALITSIDLDHQQWLGNDRESIAREKAGILRTNNVGITLDPMLPTSLIDYAHSLGNHLYRIGHEFNYHQDAGGWSWQYGDVLRVGLPTPALTGEQQFRNAAGVLMACELLQSRLPVSLAQIRQGLLNVRLPGRFQLIPGTITQIFDVAHNPAAAQQLAITLKCVRQGSATHAVFSALADKDIAGIVAPLCDLIAHWYLAPLKVQRAANLQELETIVRRVCPLAQVSTFEELPLAFDAANQQAVVGDSVLVFGSFYTVAQCCPDGI